MFYQTIYPTYQVFVALGVSCIITLVLMPLFIKLMKKEGVGQQVRADGPQQHLVKQGTPTMGGVVMLVSIVLTCVALAQWNTDLILAMAAMLLTGSLGLLDDIESVAHGRSLGLHREYSCLDLFRQQTKEHCHHRVAPRYRAHHADQLYSTSDRHARPYRNHPQSSYDQAGLVDSC